ncbi:MAG TPA: adenylate/guanylate cyclase domain-containing protein [Anaerolineales bacterium]|nr:adenylate/guanylate cyclase domain-containing protein [Anaerolineales bacterium]
MTAVPPTGTVTFLFTDIEGSTKLSQQYPDAMPALLARHNAILSQTIEAHNGFVFRIVGDSFSAAFPSASDALCAALEAQRSLVQEPWSPAPIKVRMGIHTGAAQLDVDAISGEIRYSGYTTLALTQRIMAAGHGGQVLLSRTVHDLTRDNLPPQAGLVDMGECTLKDILHPEQLYQLTVTDLPSEFPPLKTLEAFNHNLPTQLTSFIGREKEIDEIKKLITEHRMVTLTGSGGAGKTRLALEVAGELLSQFSGGLWFVELAPLADPALVAQTLLSVFKLREDPQGHRTSLEILQDHLRSKTALLILDNCEHLIEACARVSESLLRACPKLKILASSREALGIPGEISYRVPSLQTPAPADLLHLRNPLEIDSIRLFVERGTAAKPDFRLTKENTAFVAQICSRLDGIPLAIELAAARVKMLSPEQIASRLDDRFRLLTGGARTALPRQQTLRAMIDWSYSLLSDPEKMLFRRLAVFTGGWTLEAAEFVCGEGREGPDILDLISRLMDKSLVISEESDGGIRYHRLETIRQYSRERFFETDEVEAIRDRHLVYHVQLSEEIERGLQGPERKLWAHRSESEQENLRTAIEWGLAKNPESSLRIGTNMVVGIASGGYSVEGFRWLRDSMRAMESTLSVIPPPLRAEALGALAFIYVSLGRERDAYAFAEQSIALYRQLDDKSGLASALLVASIPLEASGKLVQAETALKEARDLAQSDNNGFLGAWVLNSLARVTAKLHGDMQTAWDLTEEAIWLSSDAGMDWHIANAYEMRGFLASYSGRYEESRLLFEKAMHAYQEVGAHFNVLLIKSNLAHLERQFGHYEQALERYRESIMGFRDVGQLGAVAHQLECFGFLAMAGDRNERALKLFAAADALRERIASTMTAEEQLYFDEQMSVLHQKLDAQHFERIWTTGRALTIEQALEIALGDNTG